MSHGKFRAIIPAYQEKSDDLEAWKAILALVDDPKKKKDCQDQIDRIVAKGGPPVICPMCGAGMNIYFAGELHDKRAKCPYCGAEIDLPDSYSKVVVEKHSGVGQFISETEATVYKRRSDNNGASINTEEIDQLIRDKGLIAARQELESRGIHGVKVDINGVDKSSQAYKIMEEKGLKSLEQSQNVLFVNPKQVNLVIRIVSALFILTLLAVLAYYIVRIFLLK